jgi:hypothetical protein
VDEEPRPPAVRHGNARSAPNHIRPRRLADDPFIRSGFTQKPSQQEAFGLSSQIICVISQKCYNGMNWRVDFLNDDVRAALDAMPNDIGAAFLRIARMIENYGLERMREPYVKHLQGPLWEMRMKGKDGLVH